VHIVSDNEGRDGKRKQRGKTDEWTERSKHAVSSHRQNGGDIDGGSRDSDQIARNSRYMDRSRDRREDSKLMQTIVIPGEILCVTERSIITEVRPIHLEANQISDVETKAIERDIDGRETPGK